MRIRIPMLLVTVLFLGIGTGAGQGNKPGWALNATIIEACSCPMFCQCYFNPKPAFHEGHGATAGHFCLFNNAFKVNKGMYGNVKLDGSMFWLSGDFGGDFSMGQMDWAIVTFDPSVKKQQRDGILAILPYVYPGKWNSFSVASDARMEWTATKDQADAKLDDGKTAEVALRRLPGMTGEPVVIKNLKYAGIPRNDGFVLMPNLVEGYHAGSKPFEFKGTNGFMITIDITSKDVE